MDKLLNLRVRFLDDRYHGEGDWPPSPARLFQALVAGNAVGAWLPERCAHALRWLESLPAPPEIRAERGQLGLRYTTFVPNNDLDARGGDPREVASIRVGKSIQPRHIDADRPVLYRWRFETTPESLAAAREICTMAASLFQLGRGVDGAAALAELSDPSENGDTEDPIDAWVLRPGIGAGERYLDCPQPGSLASLLQRFDANRRRFSTVREDKRVKVYFTNPPKPLFRRVSYNPHTLWALYELRATSEGLPFRAWPAHRAADLVERVRDGVAERLRPLLPARAEVLERLLVGRGAGADDKRHRVRLIPLPSIGFEKTDPSIRRLLLVMTADSPLVFDDLDWALSGLAIRDPDERETLLVKADDLSMLKHYRVEAGQGARCWRSVTAVVLPEGAARRRIDPSDKQREAKGGEERAQEEERASAAVIQALRHADLRTPAASVRVRREPFDPGGARAEAFAHGTRFAKERLWHVELCFAHPVEGPLVIGDGRYLGLGVLAPLRRPQGIHGFGIAGGLAPEARADEIAQALRRAVMARVQAHLGANGHLDPFFTGHGRDGAPLREGARRHLSFAADLRRSRLLIVAPHVLVGRAPEAHELRHLEVLDESLAGLHDLRAGPAGRLTLYPLHIDTDEDPLIRPSRVWASVTAYAPTRHPKKTGAEEWLRSDLLEEAERSRLARPEVSVLSVREGPRGGLSARIRLVFRSPQPGPILLGRTRHLGGGLFEAVSDRGRADPGGAPRVACRQGLQP